MALARRLLAVLIAAALALAPVGSAFARFNGPHGKAPAAVAMHGLGHAGAHVSHHDVNRSAPSDEGNMRMEHAGSGHCDHGKASKQEGAPATSGDCDCCGDHQSACAEFCLQKCFGQLCVFPPDRLAGFEGTDRFRLPPAERPPDWVPTPLTPPPRT